MNRELRIYIIYVQFIEVQRAVFANLFFMEESLK